MAIDKTGITVVMVMKEARTWSGEREIGLAITVQMTTSLHLGVVSEP